MHGLSIAVNAFAHLAYIMQQSSRHRGIAAGCNAAAGVIVLQPAVHIYARRYGVICMFKLGDIAILPIRGHMADMNAAPVPPACFHCFAHRRQRKTFKVGIITPA